MIVLPGYFNRQECDSLIDSLSREVQPWKPSPRKKIKTCEIPKEGFGWYYDKLDKAIQIANKIFEFDINGLTDAPALVQYQEGSFFDWHDDTHSGRERVHRKFSIIAVLSDPRSYWGGELQFFDHGIRIAKQSQGTLIAFPSWVQHRVCKITSGTRYSTVAFVGGPTKYR